MEYDHNLNLAYHILESVALGYHEISEIQDWTGNSGVYLDYENTKVPFCIQTFEINKEVFKCMNESVNLSSNHLEYIIQKVRKHTSDIYDEYTALTYHPVHIRMINDNIIAVFFISEIGDKVTWSITIENDSIISDCGTIG